MSQELQTTPKTVKGVLLSDYFKKAVALALPRHCTPDRFARVALSALTRQPSLTNCTPESVIKCMLNLSELGIEPDGRRCHLIPFKNNQKGVMECTLIMDYKGLAELAQRGGTISNIHADVICENDEFVYDRGQLLTHKIDFRKPRGNFYAAYALVRFKDGGEKVEVMSREEILANRDRSSGWRAYKSGHAKTSPWVENEAEMWKKTAFRRCSKWLVLSPEMADSLDKAERDADLPLKDVTPGLSPLGIEVEVPESENPPQEDPAQAPQQAPAAAAPAQTQASPAAPAAAEKRKYTRRAQDPAPASQPTPQAATQATQETRTFAQRMNTLPPHPAAPAPATEPQQASQPQGEPEGDPFAEGSDAPPPTQTPQQELEAFLTAEGISWSVFQAWAGPRHSGNIAEVEAMQGYQDVSASDCQRFLRARIGLLNMCRLVAKTMPQP